MGEFLGLFQFHFFTNAMISALLAGVVCGVVGTYIVSRRLVFFSGGITHASFGGIGIAHYLGADPIMGATIFAMLSALTMEWGTQRGKLREDSMIGIIWTVGMAIGIIFIYLTPGYAPNLMSFMFGNILIVSDEEIVILTIFAAFVALLFLFAHRPIMFVAFDREFAKTQGVAVNTISYLMVIVITLAIVLLIRTVGIVLLISLLTIPPTIVNSFTKSYTQILVWSVVVAIVTNIFGIYISYKFNIPTGAVIVIIMATVLGVVKLAVALRGAILRVSRA